MILAGLFIAACWFIAFFQWALMLTNSHFDSREEWPEWLQIAEIVGRSLAVLIIAGGGIFLAGIFL